MTLSRFRALFVLACLVVVAQWRCGPIQRSPPEAELQDGDPCVVDAGVPSWTGCTSGHIKQGSCVRRSSGTYYDGFSPYSFYERCNGIDDNCDGLVDEVSTSASEGCGVCGFFCPAGSECSTGGVCSELECSDGMDNDADGKSDCADSDCNGKLCVNPFDHRESFCRIVAESCVVNVEFCDNGVDDDRDGKTDCEEKDCSGKACGPDRRCVFFGTNASTGVCALYEKACGNSLDDDSDGEADCGDPDCDQQPCANDAGTCSSGFCL